MKLNRTYLFLSFSSVALVTVLIIQANWIVRTARAREEMFNEKANMVLSRTTEALRSDRATCEKIGASAETGHGAGLTVKLGKDEVHTIDSLFRHYMKFYNLTIFYSFVVAKPAPLATASQGGAANFTFNKPLGEESGDNGVELKLTFPGKRQYILAEMGPLFIASVVLILVVLVMYWRTMLSLVKEKRIAERTTDFLNNMTHEFRTPLTNIALAGKMIRKDADTRQEDRIIHYAGIILGENEKLSLQVEQVLSITALERGEIPLWKTELDLHAIIRESAKGIGLQIANMQGSLQLHLDAIRPVIMGDRIHLANAVSNLFDNAIKYSVEKPEITVHTSNLGDKLVVTISDRGIGIEKAYQERVFEKFFRVPTGNVHDVKGFGLGLSYTRKIVELHKGTIGLQSEKGIGTTFTIILPHG